MQYNMHPYQSPYGSPYGGVSSARSYEMEERRQHIIIGLAVAISIVLIAAIILFITHPWDRQEEPAVPDNIRTTLTESRMMQIWDETELAEPDMTAFKYVDTTGLIGPRFEDEAMGNVREHGTGAAVTAEQDITCDAQYYNKELEVHRPLTITLTYDASEKRWDPGELQEEPITATPLKPAPAELIMNDFNQFLASFDADAAQRFANAQIDYTPTLTVDGGTIAVVLTLDEGDRTTTANATLNVPWSDTAGWAPYVEYMDNPTSAGTEGGTNGAQQNGGNALNNSDNNASGGAAGGSNQGGTTNNGGATNNSGGTINQAGQVLDYANGQAGSVTGTIQGSAGALRIAFDTPMTVNFHEVKNGPTVATATVEAFSLTITDTTRIGASQTDSQLLNGNGANLVGRRVRVIGPLTRTASGITMNVLLITT